MAMRTNSNRMAAVASALFITLILFYTTEPRRRSFSCKTLETCLAGRPHSYKHALPVEPAVWEDERTLRDGTRHFVREIGARGEDGADGPDTLVLLLNKDEGSWSRDTRSTGRSIYDFLDLLVSTDLDLTSVSLGLMTSSLDEYADMKRATGTLPFARASVFYQPPLLRPPTPHDSSSSSSSGGGGGGGSSTTSSTSTSNGGGSSSSSSGIGAGVGVGVAAGAGSGTLSFTYDERHDPEVQRERRGALAALRNYLMLRSLRDEEHVIWVDADVVEFSPGVVQAMIAAGGRRADAGIITAACRQNGMANYDRNAWAIDRNVSSPSSSPSSSSSSSGSSAKASSSPAPPASSILDAVPAADRDQAVATLEDTRAFVDVIANGTADSDLLPLDSVGGTLLYIRAALVRQGVIFPTFNVVGTTWSQDGWIGVETEGLCYIASSLRGGGCFLLGGNHHTRHADLG